MLLHLLSTALLAAAALGAPTSSYQRTRVTFDSSGTSLVGYHFSPPNTSTSTSTSSTSAPGILIAHGLGGLQSGRIAGFAERFAAAGYHALTFDYGSWGESGGSPRNVISVAAQEDDYRAAAAWLGSQPGVDGARLVLWGTSLSGGHVLQLGGLNAVPGLVAVIAQCPHVNGPVTVSALPPASLPGLTAAGLEDAAGAAAGKAPLYIPLANRTGQFGALTQPGAYEGYKFVLPNPPPPGNVMAARFVLELPFFVPDAVAANSRVPTFIAVGKQDNIGPPNATVALAKRMGAELRQYEGGHFSVYDGAENYEVNVAYQLAFLRKNVPI